MAPPLLMKMIGPGYQNVKSGFLYARCRPWAPAVRPRHEGVDRVPARDQVERHRSRRLRPSECPRWRGAAERVDVARYRGPHGVRGETEHGLARVVVGFVAPQRP